MRGGEGARASWDGVGRLDLSGFASSELLSCLVCFPHAYCFARRDDEWNPNFLGFCRHPAVAPVKRGVNLLAFPLSGSLSLLLFLFFAFSSSSSSAYVPGDPIFTLNPLSVSLSLFLSQSLTDVINTERCLCLPHCYCAIPSPTTVLHVRHGYQSTPPPSTNINISKCSVSNSCHPYCLEHGTLRRVCRVLPETVRVTPD